MLLVGQQEGYLACQKLSGRATERLNNLAISNKLNTTVIFTTDSQKHAHRKSRQTRNSYVVVATININFIFSHQISVQNAKIVIK